MTARGLRNNNPGNIRYSPAAELWQGLADPPSDGAFCWFVDPVWGLRAVLRILLTYQDAHGCRTVADLIHRWAPPNENDTGAYAAAVARAACVAATDPVDVHKPETAGAILKAIVTQENGSQPYTLSQIADALTRAGILRPSSAQPAAPVAPSRPA